MDTMDNELRQLKNFYDHLDIRLSPSFSFSKIKANKELDKLRNSHLKMIVTFIVTACAVVYVEQVCSKLIATSNTGFAILLICCIYYAAVKLLLYTKLKTINLTLPVLQYIQKLENYKKINTFFQTYGEIIYAMILSFGVYIYLQPIIIHFTLNNKLALVKSVKIIWIIFILWTCIYTLIIKRRELKKETAIIEKYLKQLRSLKNNDIKL